MSKQIWTKKTRRRSKKIQSIEPFAQLLLCNRFLNIFCTHRNETKSIYFWPFNHEMKAIWCVNVWDVSKWKIVENIIVGVGCWCYESNSQRPSIDLFLSEIKECNTQCTLNMQKINDVSSLHLIGVLLLFIKHATINWVNKVSPSH